MTGNCWLNTAGVAVVTLKGPLSVGFAKKRPLTLVIKRGKGGSVARGLELLLLARGGRLCPAVGVALAAGVWVG